MSALTVRFQQRRRTASAHPRGTTGRAMARPVISRVLMMIPAWKSVFASAWSKKLVGEERNARGKIPGENE